MVYRLAPRCALPGPRALRPRAAAAARHMPPPGSSRGTCPSGGAPGSALPPPRLRLPARSSPFGSRPFFLYLPPHFFPPLLLPVSSFILYSLFPKANARRFKCEEGLSFEGLSFLANSSSAWWWRSWLLLAAPPLLPPPLLPPPPPTPAPAACWCNAQAAWVRPKPAGLLSMPNCPAGVALDSPVLARLRRSRLVGGEGAQLWESPTSSSGGLNEDARLTHPPSPGTRVP